MSVIEAPNAVQAIALARQSDIGRQIIASDWRAHMDGAPRAAEPDEKAAPAPPPPSLFLLLLLAVSLMATACLNPLEAPTLHCCEWRLVVSIDGRAGETSARGACSIGEQYGLTNPARQWRAHDCSRTPETAQ